MPPALMILRVTPLLFTRRATLRMLLKMRFQDKDIFHALC